MKAPSQPDPKETAAAQGAINKDTAITQYLLNATNQVTPYGNLTYSQTGQTFMPSETGQSYWYNPTTGQYSQSAPAITGYSTTANTPASSGGASRTYIPGSRKDGGNSSSSSSSSSTQTPIYEQGWQQVKGSLVPQFTATQTLSPEQQKLYDLETKLSTNLGELGVSQSQRLGQLLGSPLDLSNEATESRLMELGRSRLDPTLDRRRASTEQDLYNRGVRPGTEAYSRAMEAVSQGENDAYTQLMLQGRQQAVNEALTSRNQGINEIMALASGSQVQQPNYVNTPGTQVANTDYSSLVNQKYQADLANYQSGMSGLFGLGSSLLGGWATSDERLKTDKKKLGETDDGIGVYKYRFKGSPFMQMGVMAQEVKKKKPEAVRKTPSGYYAVNYDKVMH